jgi:hypothetical protein
MVECAGRRLAAGMIDAATHEIALDEFVAAVTAIDRDPLLTALVLGHRARLRLWYPTAWLFRQAAPGRMSSRELLTNSTVSIDGAIGLGTTRRHGKSRICGVCRPAPFPRWRGRCAVFGRCQMKKAGR